MAARVVFVRNLPPIKPFARLLRFASNMNRALKKQNVVIDRPMKLNNRNTEAYLALPNTTPVQTKAQQRREAKETFLRKHTEGFFYELLQKEGLIT